MLEMENTETKAQEAVETSRWIRYACKFGCASYNEAKGVNNAQLHLASVEMPDRETKARIKRRSSGSFDAIVWISREAQSGEAPKPGSMSEFLARSSEAGEARPAKRKTRRKRSRAKSAKAVS